MKKLINDPTTSSSEALRGIEAAHPDLRVDHQNKIIYRGDAPEPGKVGLISGGGSGHEPLHGGFVGARHARRRLRRRGVHLAGARPDAGGDQGRRRRRRRAAHREELHRRRDELRDGRRAGRRRDRRPRSCRWSPTTTSPCRTAPGRPGAAASASRCCWRRSPAPRPSRAASLDAGRRRRPEGQRQRPQHGRGADLAARCPAAGKPTFDLAEDEMEIGVGIHGEPGRRAGAAGARAARSPRCWSSRSWPTCRLHRRRPASSPSSTAWAARR